MSEPSFDRESRAEVSEATKLQFELLVSGMVKSLGRKLTRAQIEGDEFSAGFYSRKIEEAEEVGTLLSGASRADADLVPILERVRLLDQEIDAFHPGDKTPTHPPSA